MQEVFNITSEIGRLKKVMLHRPGKEIENLVPEYLDRLLFDDIPFLKVARIEHDKFAEVMRENGVKVLYLEDVATDALKDERVKEEFVDEFLNESKVSSEAFSKIKEYLLSMDTAEMVDAVMAGLKKSEIKDIRKSQNTTLEEEDYPFYLDPMPNLYFTRDPGAVIGHGLTINRMKTEARRRETIFLKYIYKNLIKTYDIPIWYNRNLPDSIEGGDILVLSSKVIAIGCSERTSRSAIEVLAKKLLFSDSGFEKIVILEIPKCRAFMHLDTVFTMIDYDKFTIHPAVKGPMHIYEITKGSNGQLNSIYNENPIDEVLKKALGLDSIEFIECGGGDRIAASREQWNDGSNTLAIAPGVVITYERNYITNELLDKRGIKVLTIPSSELSRGRGGPRCMSMPLERENINI
ncbi:MAG TPA: arginine deiminase [Clostridiaceae bacterium]|jgi:arginine deiminase|nr:arginine deiminase [Clostridiaceae bacterium]HBG38459.1 arginine deiminase [Clostridiaceae bacterium]HBN28845.1 arginine deiminase [Clostridiaceae bacterium]HCL49733.1 arginine deiminase [Clostridiaceae bacterium]